MNADDRELGLRSDELLRLIFDHAFDGISIHEERPERGARKLVACNNRFAEMAGRTREELLAMDDTNAVIKPVDKMSWVAGTRTKAQGVPYRGLVSWERPDGKDNIVEFTAVPVWVGDRLLTVGIDRDITEQRQAEEALEKERATLDSIIRFNPYGIARFDAGGHFVEANQAFVELFGGSPPPDYSLFTDPVLQQAGAAELLPKLKDGLVVKPPGTIWYDPREERPDVPGRRVCVRTVCFPICGSDGRLEHVVAMYQDATKQKQAEQALRESEALLRATIESLPFDFFAIDADGRYILQNSVCKQHWGDACGRRPADVAPNDEVRALWEESNRRAFAGEIVEGEVSYTFEAEEGHYYNVIAPIRDRGEIRGILGLNMDITERKRAEAERRRLEARMQQAQKLESLGLLAGGIAHDFNNLLAGILGFADLACRDLPPETPARESIELVIRSARQAAELTKQLLAYSGGGRLVVAPIDLSRLVEETTHLIEVSASKKATLTYQLADAPPAIEADPAQVRQIVINLITNASEALGDEPGAITIRTGARALDRSDLADAYVNDALPGGRYAFLEVADTGCGMDDETRAKVFDPFFSTKFTGLGLGLAAVLGIVRGHGGAVAVRSQPGQGSTFTVFFPCSEREPEREAPAPSGDEAWRGKGTILVAEDQPTVRALATRMLECLGLDVLTAATGREALDLFRAHAHELDAVLLDLTMPEMDGEQAFEELHRIRPDVPVILTSGYHERDVVDRFAGRGIAGFVQKPYSLAALREAIRNVLPQQAPPEPAP